MLDHTVCAAAVFRQFNGIIPWYTHVSQRHEITCGQGVARALVCLSSTCWWISALIMVRKLAAQCIEDLLQLVGPSLYPRIANSWTFKFLEVRTIPPLRVIWSMKVNLIIPGCTSRDNYCNWSPPISPPWSTVAASTWFVLLTYTLLGTTNGGMGRVLQKPLLP